MSPTVRWTGANVLEASVTDVTSGGDEVVDVRGFTHLYVYPESGGSVKYSVVADASATVHGPGAVTGAANEIIRIPVEGNFYLVEAITADCHAHPVYIGDVVRVQDEGSDVIINAKTLNFVGSGVTATDDGDGVAKIDMSAGSGGDVSIEDDGTEISAAVAVLNFTGAGVTLTESPADDIQVDIPGGSGDAVDAIPTTGLVNDLNADSITGSPADGDPIGSWPNDGSLGAFTASGDARPHYKTAGPNGHKAVEFNITHTNEAMTLGSVSAHVNNCLVVGLKQTVNSNRWAAYYCHVSSATRVNAYATRRSTAGQLEIVYWDSTPFLMNNQLFPQNEWCVLGMNIMDDFASNGVILFALYTPMGFSAWQWDLPGQIPSFDEYRVGSTTTAGEYFEGQIYRLLEYNVSLSIADMRKAMRKLADEMGLPVHS